MAGLFEKTGTRLAALAVCFQFSAFPRKAVVWMVGAHIDCIQVCTFLSEFPLQSAVNGSDVGLGRFTAGDNRLVVQLRYTASKILGQPGASPRLRIQRGQ